MTDTLGSARRLGLLLLMLVFALQSYTVQTHIHSQLVTPAVMVVSADDPGHPIDEPDPHTCKLCREIVTAVAVVPALPALLQMLDWVGTTIPPAQILSAAPAPETGWQSRAPPIH